ncbi:MAG TPA: hypothetical protein VFD03_00595 [Clostridia bacterium]|nr:hypothetical protein [Clostridia bacterium]
MNTTYTNGTSIQTAKSQKNQHTNQKSIRHIKSKNNCEAPETKKHIKERLENARKIYVPSTVAPDTVTPMIFPLKIICSELDQSLPGNYLFTYPTGYSSLF